MESREFEELVQQYEPMIYHVMRSLSIYKNQEEFYQTGLIALWDASKRFEEGKGKFSSFAYSYIKGRMLTKLSKDKKVDEYNVYPEETFWELMVDESIETNEEFEQLYEYCRDLTDKQTKWVIGAFYLGMSVAEIAACEGVSLAAVKKWRAGAIRKIRERFEKEIV